MKVDPRAESTQQVPAVSAEVAKVPPKPAGVPNDAVKLSDALKVADEAVRAAAHSGDVRPEAIIRARQLLEAGELGLNFESLADRIIDSLLESRDDRT